MLTRNLVLFVVAISSIVFSQTTLNTPGTVNFSALSPNGVYLAGIDTNRIVKLYNLATSTTITTSIRFATDARSSGMTLQWAPDGKKLYGFVGSFSASSPSSGTTFYPALVYLIDVSSYVAAVAPGPSPKHLVNTIRVFPVPATGSTPINFELPSSTQPFKIEIATLQGEVVRILYSDNDNTVVWDKKNQYGDPVPPGRYAAKIMCGKSVEAKMVSVAE